MKVCLVNDTSDAPNLGAIATSRAMRWLINEAGGSVASTLYQHRIELPQPDDTLEARHSSSEDGAGQELLDIAPASWNAFDECAARVMDGEWFPWIREPLSECDA